MPVPGTSNTQPFATKTGTYPNVTLASGLAANSYTLICTGPSAGAMLTDLLFRNFSAGTAWVFEFIICATGSQTTEAGWIGQFTIPANSGNNGGTTALAALTGLIPNFFDIDFAGNKYFNLESGISVYVKNLAALTADVTVIPKLKSF